MIGTQQSNRLAGCESLGLQGVVDEDLATGVGNCSSLSYRWTELSVQIDSEANDVLTQRLAVLALTSGAWATAAVLIRAEAVVPLSLARSVAAFSCLSLRREAERFSLEASVTATLAVFQPSMPAR